MRDEGHDHRAGRRRGRGRRRHGLARAQRLTVGAARPRAGACSRRSRRSTTSPAPPPARSRPGRTNAIGVVAPFFTQPSVIERLRGVSRTLARRGLPADPARRGASRPAARPVPLARRARPDRRPAGDLARADRARGCGACERAGVPIVLLDRDHPTIPCITIDDVEGGRMAAEHLLGLGHRRIAFLGDVEANLFGFDSSAHRREGFEAAMAAAGVPVAPGLDHRAGRTAATPHASPRPSCWRRARGQRPSSRPPTSRRSGCWRRRRQRACRCPSSSRSSASTTWRPPGTRG